MSLLLKVIKNLTIFFLGFFTAIILVLYFFSDLLKYREVEATLLEIQKNKYDPETYNCVNFSQDAVKSLKQKNIESNVVVIKQPGQQTGHAVIGLWIIDPQNGEFINGADYIGDYDQLKKKLGWSK